MRWPLVLLIVFHGLIHLIGAPPAWGGAIVGGAAEPLVPLAGTALRAAGGAWLVACLLLLVAALGLALRRGWWRAAALAAVVASQALIILWWRDARMGTVPNLSILVAVVWPLTPSRRRVGLPAGAPV